MDYALELNFKKDLKTDAGTFLHKLVDSFLKNDRYTHLKAQKHAVLLHSTQNGHPGARALEPNRRGETAAEMLRDGPEKSKKVNFYSMLKELEKEERGREEQREDQG